MLAFKCFWLQISVHCKTKNKKKLQFASLLCVKSSIHKPPSCQLIVVLLFLQLSSQCYREVGGQTEESSKTVQRGVRLLWSFTTCASENSRLLTGRSRRRNSSGQGIDKKKMEKCKVKR